MSQSTAARPLRTSAPQGASAQSPQLRVVEGRKGQVKRTLVPIISIIVVIFLLAIVAPLIINTDMARMAYAIRDQQVVLNSNTATIETMEAQLLDVQSTTNLEQQAAAIGMVPAGSIGVISLQNHEISGGVPAR